jgi:hypothetical protein
MAMAKDFDETVAEIKQETFDTFKSSRNVWIIEERGAEFIVHRWTPGGVGAANDYPTLRKAVARLLQLLKVGPVAPQTWPEEVCIGNVTVDSDAVPSN